MKIKEKLTAIYNLMKKRPLLIFGSAAIAGLLSALTLTVLALAMWTGLAYVMVKAETQENNKNDFNLVFNFMSKLPYLFMLGIIIFVSCFAGLLFLIIPGIFIMAMFIYAPFYLAFDDKGIMESLRLSCKTVIDNNLMTHVVIILVLWLINLIGLQLFVGWVITMPLSVGFLIKMYDEVKIRQKEL